MTVLRVLCAACRDPIGARGVWRPAMRVAFVTVMVAMSLLIVEGPCRAAPFSVKQDQLKAAYLYNFLHVVHWPGRRQAEASPAAKIIGILGDTPLNDAMDDLADSVSKKQKGTISVVHFGRYREGMALGGCHILFVSDSEKENFSTIATQLKHIPVLTVADYDGFLKAGGMIALVEQQNRVRYRINRQAATEAGLRLSSRLLQTAIIVQDE